jgi:hypothetical protein
MRSLNFAIDLCASSRTTAPELTQPPIEISTRDLYGGTGWPARNTDTLTAICEQILYKMWDPRRLTILRASMVSYRSRFAFLLTLIRTQSHELKKFTPILY